MRDLTGNLRHLLKLCKERQKTGGFASPPYSGFALALWKVRTIPYNGATCRCRQTAFWTEVAARSLDCVTVNGGSGRNIFPLVPGAKRDMSRS